MRKPRRTGPYPWSVIPGPSSKLGTGSRHSTQPRLRGGREIVSEEEEIPTYSKKQEAKKMADAKEKPSTTTRAVGVDIGTGFISCAEEEGGKKIFRKVRDAFFKLNPSKFLEGSANNFGEGMLKKAGAHYVKIDGTLYEMTLLNLQICFIKSA